MTKVDICMATFRRPGVVEALASLSRLEVPEEVQLRVIVADNDEMPSAKDDVIASAAEHGLDLIYVHAPASNIAIARNACLNLATGDFVGFMDDDETVAPNWLVESLRVIEAADVDGVFGPSLGIYPEHAPAWMKALHLHDNVPVRRHGEVQTGHTCNALICRAVIGETRFKLETGKTGGEDTELFRRLWLQGARYEIADEAFMTEPVPDSRLSYKWLADRQYRAGQTYGAYLDGDRWRRTSFAVAAVVKAAFCYGRAGTLAFSPTGRAKWALRGKLHLGVISGSVGRPALELYGG